VRRTHSVLYSQNISILVVLLYSWRIALNVNKHMDLQDVYYGKYDGLSLHSELQSMATEMRETP
jgi:hypothetical protein